MPYRIDIDQPPRNALDLLIDLGALDIESADKGLAAILPDAVTPDMVSAALGSSLITASAARGHDNDSVWLLNLGSIDVGGVRLADSDAFGTGYHPTTALCLEAIEKHLSLEPVSRILDVGTGSGILALVALAIGVPRALALIPTSTR